MLHAYAAIPRDNGRLTSKHKYLSLSFFWTLELWYLRAVIWLQSVRPTAFCRQCLLAYAAVTVSNGWSRNCLLGCGLFIPHAMSIPQKKNKSSPSHPIYSAFEKHQKASHRTSLSSDFTQRMWQRVEMGSNHQSEGSLNVAFDYKALWSCTNHFKHKTIKSTALRKVLGKNTRQRQKQVILYLVF